MIAILLMAIANVIVSAVVLIVAIPFAKLQWRRRQSRAHIPQPSEVWAQLDTETLFYIDTVGPNGVGIVSISQEDQKNVQTWVDTWDEWRARLKAHTVLYTGQRQPLVGV